MSLEVNLKKILIIDFGSQFTQLIARRIRELGVYSEIISHKKTNKLNQIKNIKGIILSGGPLNVYQTKNIKSSMPIRLITLKAILKEVKKEMQHNIIIAWNLMTSYGFLCLIFAMWIVCCFFGLLILFLKNPLSLLKDGIFVLKRWLLLGLKQHK